MQWRLDDLAQTLVFAAQGGGVPCCLYWGRALPESEDLSALASASQPDVTGGMLDRVPQLSLCPTEGRAWPGQPGLMLRDAQGQVLHPRFRLDEAGPETGQDSNGLWFLCRDDSLGLQLRICFEIAPSTHVISGRCALMSDGPVTVDFLAAPVLPAAPHASEMIDFAGRWIGEVQTVRTPWGPGARLRDNRTGRTGHEHVPGLIVPGPGTTNTSGEAWAWHYGWSGGHRMVAEELPDGRRQIMFGHAAHSEIRPGTTFETARLYLSYSDQGLNGIATAFQRHVRDRIVTWPHPERPRPVHYNCWEAVYFDHDLPKLKQIATRAADLGAERFVLDDGWFGIRDDDTSGLGDWQIDRRKWPEGLSPLIDHVHGLGMTFGLWFEPEMVNPDSELYRKRPDWVLGPEDQPQGRQQLVLDMAQPELRDHLFQEISAVLADHDIDYIKWDHNRVLPFPDAAQTRGTYALLARLRAAFPGVEIESCASGGGRMDFGVLGHTQRVWLSDSNDALERLRLQHEAALFLPLDVTGSHVGPRHCHTSGRVLDMELRAWVAAQRHMGFEMDPAELTPDEADILRDVTRWWKDNRAWRSRADILRLDSADPAVIAEQQLSAGGDRFVLFAGRLASSGQILPRPLRLTGLDPKASYRLHLRNRASAHRLSRGAPLLKTQDLTASGTWLMTRGIDLPWAFPATIWVVEGLRLPQEGEFAS